MDTPLSIPNPGDHADFCQSCGALAPTKYVEFYQNIGAIILRFHKSIKGKFCKSCINQYFWEYTLFTLLLGWWGAISFFVTPFHILNNVVRYIGSLGMGSVPDPMSSPLTWLKGMPTNLRPDNIRARELESLRKQNNIIHGQFLGFVMQSPGITKMSIEQEFSEFKKKQPSATTKQIYEAIIQDRYLNTCVSGGMTLEAARSLLGEPWALTKVKSAVERIETLDELIRYVVEEHEDFWNRTPDPLGVNTRIAEILGYYR